jgi:uncharacterized protein (TIGR02246 family)
MAQTTSATVREAISGANAHFMAAFARGDAAGVAACYTSDAQLLPQHSAEVAGRPAIETYWRGAVQSGLTRVRLDTLEIYGEGEFATEVGRYTLLAGADAEADHGKYVVLWRREAGHYLLHRDIWTSSVP